MYIYIYIYMCVYIYIFISRNPSTEIRNPNAKDYSPWPESRAVSPLPSRNPTPETRNLKPGTRDPNFET